MAAPAPLPASPLPFVTFVLVRRDPENEASPDGYAPKKVVKIGAEVIAHARYTVFQMAEVAVPCDLFGRILAMIDDLRPRQVARC